MAIEPLLAIEAGDAIAPPPARPDARRAALVAELGSQVGRVRRPAATSVCSGPESLADLRIPGGKPGIEGARVSRTAPPIPHRIRRPDHLAATRPQPTLNSDGSRRRARRYRGSKFSRWNAPICRAGSLPASSASSSASPMTLQFLADTTEGNLLAARQELAKSACLAVSAESHPGSGRECRRRRGALRCFSTRKHGWATPPRLPHTGGARERGRRYSPAALATRRRPPCAGRGSASDGPGTPVAIRR